MEEKKNKVMASTSKPLLILDLANGDWVELTIGEAKELANDLWFKAEGIERHIERLIEDSRFYKDMRGSNHAKEGKIKKP